MLRTQKVIVGLGELLWDIFPSGKQLGGAPANFAYHVNQLGETGVIVSSVGTDNLGYAARDWIKGQGMTDEYVSTDNYRPTGIVEIDLKEIDNPRFKITQNVAWDRIPWNDQLKKLANSADAVCFGTLASRSPESRETVIKFLQNTRVGCLKIFDVNLRQNYYDPELINSLLKLSNVLKLNIGELNIIRGALNLIGSPEEMIRVLRINFGLDFFGLTQGEQGASIFSAIDCNHHFGFRVKKVENTVGAGDAFAAAMAVGILRGYSINDINWHANRIASYVCTQVEATPTIPEEYLYR